MNRRKVNILLVEDDEDDVFLTRGYLSESSYFQFSVTWESSITEARNKILSKEYDACLVDYRLGGSTGLDLIHFVKQSGIRIPVILLTGQGDQQVDLEAMRYGAADYLLKGELNAQTLERSIRYALSHAEAIKELDDKERRYRSLFERSIDPIFLADDNFKFTDVNASMLALFNYTREDATSVYLKDLFFSEQAFNDFREIVTENGQIRDFEAVLKNNSGQKFICLINCVFIRDLTSESFCYQGIIHDLTMRKKAERELLMAEKLLMTGKIARTIAHEVRNPLTNLNLALEQLKDEVPVSKTSELYTGIISRNANRIEQLISEMLNSSRPKELHLELVSVQELIEETITLVMDRINLNQMQLLREINPELPRVLLDKEKIKIALLNILINAIEAMKPGHGILTVKAECNDRHVFISILDNGIGIAEEELDKMFDPFYTGKQGGMGLGLTSTQSILNSHNAGIDVNSKLGQGTTFRILFNLPEG